MKLKKIIINNFLSYNQAIVDLEDLRKVLIVGSNNGDTTNSNGSGKTNLCEAIGWVVWGKSKAKTIDLNVKEGCNSCSVKIEFEHDGKQCSIERIRNKNNASSSINFIIDGETSNGSSVTETDKKIIDFIKIDYFTYINSVYLRQDDIYSLANPQRTDEGRTVLEQILNLEEYDKYEKLTKNKIKDIEKVITESLFFIDNNKDINSKINIIKNSINEHNNNLKKINIDIENKNKELQNFESNYNSSKDSLVLYKSIKEQIDSLSILISSKNSEINKDKECGRLEIINRDNRKKDLLQKISEKEKIESERLSFLKEMEVNSIIKKELNEYAEKNITEKDKLKKLQENYNNKYKEKISSIKDVDIKKEELNKLTLNIKNIKAVPGEKCSVCMSDVTEHNIELIKKHNRELFISIHSELEKQVKIMEVLEKQENEISLEIKSQEKIISDLENKIQILTPKIITKKQYEDKLILFSDKLSQISKYQSQLEDLPENKIIEMLSEKIKTLKKEIENAISKKKEFEDKLNNIKLDTEFLNQLEQKIKTIKENLELYNKNKYTIIANLKNDEKNLEQLNNVLDEYNKRETLLIQDKKKLEILEQLEKAFSSKGVRAKILEDAIRDLEKEADELLKRISNGRLSLSFITEKSDKIVFEVHINDGEKTLPFSLYSGGEKFRIAFVLRIALSKLLLRKANSKLEFLIIDEAVSSLDSNGTEMIMEIINELQDEFKTILVITHRNDIKIYFDKIINVFRDENGSRIIQKNCNL